MNNLQLRKCKVTYQLGKEYYFHKWVERGMTKYHGEDPQKDSTYVETLALVEDINTGETDYAAANCIVFDVLELPK